MRKSFITSGPSFTGKQAGIHKMLSLLQLWQKFMNDLNLRCIPSR